MGQSSSTTSAKAKLRGLFILGREPMEMIYGPAERDEIASLVDIIAPPQTMESIEVHPELLANVDVIFSGWGMPKVDANFLAAAPNLKAIFYGSGTIKGFATDAMWDRGIVVTSAYAANAVPVAEYALGAIFMSLKQVWYFASECKRSKTRRPSRPVAGAYGTTIGLISLGMVARHLVKLLQPFDLKVIAFDPFVSPEAAQAMGVELVSLDELFRRSDVVSLHTPWLKETEGMIRGDHFRLMKPYSTFLNTARGAVVNEPEMIDALRQRTDITAVLDVTWPEPPDADSPIYQLPNIVYTPHIAGSMNQECRRMGRYMIEELRRYLAGEPLAWGIDKKKAAILA